jgi:holliday junction DNA helicase RuvA
MISYLTGQVINPSDKSLTIMTNGVGYEVLATLNLLLTLKVGSQLSLHIYSHIKEDQFTLFGFENIEEKEIFKKLISVSGVGPRSALTMLSIATPSNLIRYIESGSSDNFPKIPGIGKKTIEKIILELRGKFGDVVIINESEDIKSARMALETLGYNARDISTTLSTLHPDLDMNSIIRESLKKLSNIK